jgi:hypothetical protein
MQSTLSPHLFYIAFLAFTLSLSSPLHALDTSYDSLAKRMREICAINSKICKLSSINSMFGLGHQGLCGNSPCEQLVMHIGCASPSLPQIFVSGALHGDERLGPVATVEFGALLMRNYRRSWWSTRMVDTRCIVLFPVANAIGFYLGQREDNGVDPNRRATAFLV